MHAVGLKCYELVPDGELYQTGIAETVEDVIGVAIEGGGLTMVRRSPIVSRYKKHTMRSTHNASSVAL